MFLKTHDRGLGLTIGNPIYVFPNDTHIPMVTMTGLRYEGGATLKIKDPTQSLFVMGPTLARRWPKEVMPYEQLHQQLEQGEALTLEQRSALWEARPTSWQDAKHNHVVNIPLHRGVLVYHKHAALPYALRCYKWGASKKFGFFDPLRVTTVVRSNWYSQLYQSSQGVLPGPEEVAAMAKQGQNLNAQQLRNLHQALSQ